MNFFLRVCNWRIGLYHHKTDFNLQAWRTTTSLQGIKSNSLPMKDVRGTFALKKTCVRLIKTSQSCSMFIYNHLGLVAYNGEGYATFLFRSLVLHVRWQSRKEKNKPVRHRASRAKRKRDRWQPMPVQGYQELDPASELEEAEAEAEPRVLVPCLCRTAIHQSLTIGVKVNSLTGALALASCRSCGSLCEIYQRMICGCVYIQGPVLLEYACYLHQQFVVETKI